MISQARNVEKITIRGYSDTKLTSEVSPSFTLPINPETYAEKRKLIYDTKKGIGNQGTNPKYGATEPEELKLDFLLDNTGAVEGNILNGTSVPNQVKALLDAVYRMEGGLHKPKFLKVAWGANLVFPCVLTALDINYTLFKPNGEPLRAKVSATFLNHLAEEKRIQLEDKSSPDLTHVRTVTPADKLYLLAHKEYGDVRYTYQLAQANGLTSLRKIRPGDELMLPPFETNNEK